MNESAKERMILDKNDEIEKLKDKIARLEKVVKAAVEYAQGMSLGRMKDFVAAIGEYEAEDND